MASIGITSVEEHGAPLERTRTREQGFQMNSEQKAALKARIKAKEIEAKKNRPQNTGDDGTRSVLSFKRDEYFGQRA